VLGKAPSAPYGAAPGARPKLAEVKGGPKPSRKKTGNEQLDEAVAMLLILVDSVAKAGPGDRPVLDEALGLLTAVEEYATAAAAAAQAQLQTPDAKNMLDGLKGKTHESQPSKGGDARRNLDKESLKLLEAASMHLEVLGKFADADPQVSDIVVKLKDIASHLEAGKNQYSEVAKKVGATKVGVAVKKEREGLKAQASKLKSVPKAAGKQVKAAIAEARSKPLLKRDDYEILKAKGSELVQAVTRKIQDNLVKNQAEQRRQVMERQAMVDSELGGSWLTWRRHAVRSRQLLGRRAGPRRRGGAPGAGRGGGANYLRTCAARLDRPKRDARAAVPTRHCLKPGNGGRTEGAERALGHILEGRTRKRRNCGCRVSPSVRARPGRPRSRPT
jgi:hypothetical protein